MCNRKKNTRKLVRSCLSRKYIFLKKLRIFKRRILFSHERKIINIQRRKDDFFLLFNKFHNDYLTTF